MEEKIAQCQQDLMRNDNLALSWKNHRTKAATGMPDSEAQVECYIV
jgi:hypothetical protein